MWSHVINGWFCIKARIALSCQNGAGGLGDISWRFKSVLSETVNSRCLWKQRRDNNLHNDSVEKKQQHTARYLYGNTTASRTHSDGTLCIRLSLKERLFYSHENISPAKRSRAFEMESTAWLISDWRAVRAGLGVAGARWKKLPSLVSQFSVKSQTAVESSSYWSYEEIAL